MFEAKAPIRPIIQPKARAPTPPLSPPQVSHYIDTPADLLRYVHDQEEVIDLTGEDEPINAPLIEVVAEHTFEGEPEDQEEEALELRLEVLRARKRAQKKEKAKAIPITYDKGTLNF